MNASTEILSFHPHSVLYVRTVQYVFLRWEDKIVIGRDLELSKTSVTFMHTRFVSCALYHTQKVYCLLIMVNIYDIRISDPFTHLRGKASISIGVEGAWREKKLECLVSRSFIEGTSKVKGSIL